MSKITKISSKIFFTVRVGLIAMGVFFLLLLIGATTSLPFWARYNLAHSKAGVPANTKSILVMGGGGFPSESVLIRLWYTADLASKHPQAKVIVATPGEISDSSSTLYLMCQYLILNGVDSSRLVLESHGLNTRHQALMTYEILKKCLFEEPLVVVTSPSHLYRSVKSFEKAGFIGVGGLPCIEMVLETDLRLHNEELGGNSYVPTAANSISLRYKFWDYLKFEVDVLREYIAIAYYKMKSWI